jgi:trimeric autotransporter adhesin
MSFNGLRLSRFGTESRMDRRKNHKSRRRPIVLEQLEVRLVMSTSTWSGGGANANWSTAGNWDTVPTNGSDIVFPSTATNLIGIDDLGPAMTFGSLTFSGGGYQITASNGSTASFTSIDSSQTSASNTFNVPITLPAATTVTVDNAGASLVLAGLVSGSVGLTKAGGGTLDLTADNTYSGSTAVSAGTLLVDGNQGGSAVAISSGATLGGVGTVGTINSTGGTVDPGNPAPGMLTDTGDLTLAPDSTPNNSTFTVVLDGTSPGSGTGKYSQVQAAGTISLTGASLSATVSPDFVPAPGSTYTIIDNTGTSAISGTFNGQAEGSVIQISGMPFSISYIGGTNTNSVVLTELDQTAVTFSPASPVSGQSVALTATVTGPTGSPTPTGTVEFFNGTTSLGAAMPLTDGAATLNVSTLPVADNSITAQYSGDSNYPPSTSPAVTVTVALAASSTTVVPSTTTPVFGQSVTLTATVQATAPGAGTPTGTVQFFNGTTPLGNALLSSGSAMISVTSLPIGADSITAQYMGDADFAGSTSPGVTVTVGQANTTTTLIPSTTTPVFGQSVTLSATVQAVAPGAGVPTGTVQFFNGTTSLGTASLASGTASIATSTLSLGANSITVKYSGDTNFNTQTSIATTLTVGQASTTANISSTPSSPVFGQAVTITANMIVISPGAGTPTGTVQFMSGSTSLGTATLSSGAASITTSNLPTGTDTITTIYSGDTDFQGSTSTGSITVGQSASSISLSASNSNPAATQSVTLTATVTATSPGVGSPTGTVEFLNNGSSIGTSTLSGGTATLTANLPIAANSITAIYFGDKNFSSSTSTTTPVTVGTPNEQWLNQVFEILLHRPITAAEIPYWNKQLAKGRTRYSIASEISKGKEARIANVQDAFNSYLGRDGTPAEVAAVVRIARRTNTSVQAAILGSNAFYKAAGGTNTFFFQGLLISVYGTTFPDIPIEHMLSAGVPRVLVANRLLQANLGRQSLLTFVYNSILQRDPTQPEIALYLSQMKNENVFLRTIAVTLLGSNEFFVRATSPISSS